MVKLIRQIQEAANSANSSERINQSMSAWIRYCREQSISLMGLENLLNFYLSEEFTRIPAERCGACFVDESEMQIDVVGLQRQIEELKKENRQLRDELASYKEKSSRRGWFGKK